MLKLRHIFNTSKYFNYPSELPTHNELSLIALGLQSSKRYLTSKPDGLKCIQLRYKSTIPPPPGVTPVDPKAIPFLDPRFRRSRGGGKILLLIPIITFGLGTWQIKRLKWKTELIENINSKTAMDPVPLPLDLEEVSKMEFRKVTVTGTFDHENELLYGPRQCFVNGEPDSQVLSKTGEGSFGYNLITPLTLSDSGERILVNRGWIATKTTKPHKRPWSKTEGEQTITGVIRKTEPPAVIGPTRNPEYNVWHYRNIEEMAETYNCLPILIDATAEHSIPKCLWAGQTRTQIRNEHLAYILTWYSLSAATYYMWYARYMKR